MGLDENREVWDETGRVGRGLGWNMEGWAG